MTVSSANKRAFAQKFSKTLREAGEKTSFRYDEASFSLVSCDDQGNAFHLGNAYDEYRQTPPKLRWKVLRQYARGWLDGKGPLPKTFVEAETDVLPQVRGRAKLEAHMSKRGAGQTTPYHPLGEALAATLAYDRPESIAMLSASTLVDWGVSFEIALQRARINLADKSTEDFLQPAPGVWLSPWHDNYDASRIVLTEVIRKWAVKGDSVAMVPNRDTLILTGSEDDDGLLLMATIAEREARRHHPLSTTPLVLRGDEWQLFVPPSGFNSSQPLKRLWLASVQNDYSIQHAPLQGSDHANHTHAFVASYWIMQHKRTGDCHSLCAWTIGIPSLLPRAEYIAFIRRHGTNQGEVVGHAQWGDVALLNLMKPLDMYPPRFLVTDAPSAEDLAHICQSVSSDDWTGASD